MIQVWTSMGRDFFLLKSVSGKMRLSGLFEFDLEMLCDDPSVDPATMMAQNVTVSMVSEGDRTLFYNGYISRFWYEGSSDRATIYRATVVPWLWLLTQATDCRIFQTKSVPEILEQVFGEFGFADFDLGQLRNQYEKREYCVQYRETTFDFVSRLMEEEGIFYFFRHTDGKHVLHLADSPVAYQEIEQFEVDFPTQGDESSQGCQLSAWEHRYRFVSGSVSHTDYNFKSPKTGLLSLEPSRLPVPQTTPFEVFDFPGRFVAGGKGRELARIRMQEIEADYDQVNGAGNYETFRPAGIFKVNKHRLESERGKQYVISEVDFRATVGGSYLVGSESGETAFENRFVALPAETVFRPKRLTPGAVVEGPQTAVVVGPKGEEIHTDEHGRVKVHFHWDRRSKRNEKSSCWIRVSQSHAGGGWGGIDLPRIGEEVIVDFLEGDPDQPLITGRVYNGDNRPPFALPAGMTRSGMKSNTHKGSGSNEISMDDTAGAEQIRTHAQFNMDTAVGNNQTLVVNVDRTDSIGNNDSQTVGNNSTTNVGNNKDVTVGNNMNVNVGNKMVFNAATSITLKCGASKIYMNSGGIINITGTIITTAAAANAAVAAPLTQIVGAAMLTTVGGVNMMTGGVCKVAAAGLASVSGGKVDVTASGTTAIKGGLITLN